jgi:hypothetical protein
MYIESVPNRNSPPAILLRESFRDGAKIKKRAIANLSDWPAELVEGLRTLLKGGTASSSSVPGAQRRGRVGDNSGRQRAGTCSGGRRSNVPHRRTDSRASGHR